MTRLYSRLANIQKRWILPWRLRTGTLSTNQNKINLGSGSVLLPGYWNIDLSSKADLIIDLEKDLLPFAASSMEAVVCISTINYFTRERAQEIIRDVYRVLKPGGIARFASQDLRLIAERYIARDHSFFFQTLPNGRERFIGNTFGDKVNSWFYGYHTTGNKYCRYVYDYETLETLFREAGFSDVQQMDYQASSLPEIELIDNREDQMFFLEAKK